MADFTAVDVPQERRERISFQDSELLGVTGAPVTPKSFESLQRQAQVLQVH